MNEGNAGVEKAVEIFILSEDCTQTFIAREYLCVGACQSLRAPRAFLSLRVCVCARRKKNGIDERERNDDGKRNDGVRGENPIGNHEPTDYVDTENVREPLGMETDARYRTTRL